MPSPGPVRLTELMSNRPGTSGNRRLDSLNLSGTKFRKMLRGGEDIPEWFAFKSVVAVLRAEWK